MNCTGTERRREICSKYIVKPVLYSVCSENDNISKAFAIHRTIGINPSQMA